MENEKIHLSPTSSMLPDVLVDAHSSPAGGHFSYLKTFSRISANFFYPGICTSISNSFKIVMCVNKVRIRLFVLLDYSNPFRSHSENG